MLVPQNKEALLHLSQVNQWICDLKRYTIFKKQTEKKTEGTPTFPSSVTPGGLFPFSLPPSSPSSYLPMLLRNWRIDDQSGEAPPNGDVWS